MHVVDIHENIVGNYTLSGIEPAQKGPFVIAGNGIVHTKKDRIDSCLDLLRTAFPFNGPHVKFYDICTALGVSADGNITGFSGACI